jgi:DNA-binding MarR family transcriptional regulator
MNKTQDEALFELNTKWGETIQGVGGGWTGIPNLLLKKQGILGLSSTELNVLINIISFWWEASRVPFPLPEKIADEIGISSRSVFRTIASLEEKGFINRVSEPGKSTKYELHGLVEKLKTVKNTL